MTAPSESAALVSVGVPVYNGGATLEAAVRALLAQTHRSLEILISDNGSSDETEAIARRVAAADERIRYHRQVDNLGAVANFRFVLEESVGEYFMWAAADDLWEPTYIERNLAALQVDPGMVASVSKVRWLIDGEDAGLAAGTAALEGSESDNVKSYLRTARDNSRFYGLFRRQALVDSFPGRSFFSLDLAMMLGTLRYGRHGELDEVLMSRRRTDPASYVHYADAADGPVLERWFPMLAFTRHVLREVHIPLSPATIAFLVVRNGFEHFRYAATRDSMYGRVGRAVMRLGDPVRRRAVSA